MSDAVTRVSAEVEGTEISFETGKLAKQASGAVVVRAGDTMVLCTATAGNLRDVDFLPLTVDVEERMYAAGKIPGSFFKREGRAGEKATLTARLIDRPIRPLFPKGWRYETQLVALPISVDHVNPYDVLAMNGASAALMVSHIPFPTPVGAVRIGKIDGNFVVNPSEEDLVEGLGPRPDRGRHRRGDPDGRGGRQRDPRGGDPRRARHRPRGDQEAVRRPARAGREGRQAQGGGGDPAGRPGAARGDQGVAWRRARGCHPGRGQARAPGRHEGGRGAGARAVRGRSRGRDLRRVPPAGSAGVRPAREDADPRADRRPQEAARRAQRRGDPPDLDRDRRGAPRARLGPVHPRPDPGAVGGGARDDPRGDAAGHARPGDGQALLPPLQLPAVLGRGGRVHARPQAA